MLSYACPITFEVFPPPNIFLRQFRRQFLHEINLANLRKFATPEYTPGLSLFGMFKRIISAFPKGPLIVQLERLSKAQQAPVTLPPHKHNELPKAGTKSYGTGHEPPPLLSTENTADLCCRRYYFHAVSPTESEKALSLSQRSVSHCSSPTIPRAAYQALC